MGQAKQRKGKTVRVYLDNCCYNRPYDDQSQVRISLEAQAKLHIQELIRENKLELVTSYMLTYENSRNRVESKKNAIQRYMEDFSLIHVSASRSGEVEKIAEMIHATGVKPADSIHAACGIISESDYLITTDDRLLRYRDERIKIVDPTEFVRILEGGTDDE